MTVQLVKTHGDQNVKRPLGRLEIPITTVDWATLYVPRCLTPEQFDQLIVVLRAMRPGIVREEGSPHA